MPKFEVEIDFADFFNEDDKSKLFQSALQNAILQKLNDNQWVQSNIAYYLFNYLKEEIFVGELDKIKVEVRDAIEKHKEIQRWEIKHHKVFEKAVSDGLDEVKEEIKEKAKEIAHKFFADEGREYDSFYGRVADACVDRVFENFVNAMIEKEERKNA